LSGPSGTGRETRGRLLGWQLAGCSPAPNSWGHGQSLVRAPEVRVPPGLFAPRPKADRIVDPGGRSVYGRKPRSRGIVIARGAFARSAGVVCRDRQTGGGQLLSESPVRSFIGRKTPWPTKMSRWPYGGRTRPRPRGACARSLAFLRCIFQVGPGHARIGSTATGGLAGFTFDCAKTRLRACPTSSPTGASRRVGRPAGTLWVSQPASNESVRVSRSGGMMFRRPRTHNQPPVAGPPRPVEEGSPRRSAGS